MPDKILPSTTKTSSFIAGSPLPLYYQIISKIIRTCYFSNILSVNHNRSLSKNTRPKLIICSHRNSAFDGYIALKFFPKAQALASIQLLNSQLMRIFFTGIPVVRKKDRLRFGINANTFESPSAAAIAHIKAGGDLILFPEGSSEWGYKPLEYQRGAARIIRTLFEENVAFDIIPVGLFYIAPDKFSSSVEICIGKNIEVLPQNDLTIREWEKNIHTQISTALDAVSVNCPDIKTFNEASNYAYHKMKENISYSESFIDYQDNIFSAETLQKNNITKPSLFPIYIWRWFAFCLMFILFPIFLSSLIASHFADARNTVSFFKIIGGTLASFVWLPILVVFFFISPLFMGLSTISALLGLWIIRKKGSDIC